MIFNSLAPQLLDSAAGDAANKIADGDGLDLAQLNHHVNALRLGALIVVLSLSDAITSNDLDENELPSSRFDALMAGFSGEEDGEDELVIDEPTYSIIAANVEDAFASFGVSVDLIKAAFGDDAAEADQAIETIAEIVESSVPTDEDELNEFVQEFVFGANNTDIDDDGSLYDAATLGKTTVKSGKFGKVIYKAVKAVRNGKIVIKNTRVGGKVRLSPKQKQALIKARTKAHNSSAMKKRLRSVTKGKRAGLY
ncbi:hypothetical protein [Acinetobacter defluvii]|nr:hypothetical protein [Acinetobacter defluvii]